MGASNSKLNIAMLQIKCRGFFPKGGGQLNLSIQSLSKGKCLAPIRLLERREIQEVAALAFTAGGLKPSISDRMASSAGVVLKKVCGC